MLKVQNSKKTKPTKIEAKVALESQKPFKKEESKTVKSLIQLKRYISDDDPNWISAKELIGEKFFIHGGNSSSDGKIYFKLTVDSQDSEMRTMSIDPDANGTREFILSQAKEAFRRDQIIGPLTIEEIPLKNNKKFFDIVSAEIHF